MQKLHKLLGVLHYLVLAAVLCSAQSTTGRVRGTVLDISGAVIPGAAIRLRGSGGSKALKSNEVGLFEVDGLAGSYVLTADAPGFARFEAKLEVGAGKLVL